jgi:hypothetical protein
MGLEIARRSLRQLAESVLDRQGHVALLPRGPGLSRRPNSRYEAGFHEIDT